MKTTNNQTKNTKSAKNSTKTQTKNCKNQAKTKDCE